MPNLLSKLGKLNELDCRSISFWFHGSANRGTPILSKEIIAFLDSDKLKASAYRYYTYEHGYLWSSTMPTYKKLFGPLKNPPTYIGDGA